MTFTEGMTPLEIYRLRRTIWREKYKYIYRDYEEYAMALVSARQARRAWLASLPKPATRQPLPEGWTRKEYRNYPYYQDIKYVNENLDRIQLSCTHDVSTHRFRPQVLWASIGGVNIECANNFAVVLTIAAQDAAIIEAELRQAVSEWKASK